MRVPVRGPSITSYEPSRWKKERSDVMIRRCFFSKKVAAVDRPAANIRRPFFPNGNYVVPVTYLALTSPESENRTCDALPATICLVKRKVECGSRTVILTHGVDRRWVANDAQVLGQGFRSEVVTVARFPKVKEFGVGADEAFRQGKGLGEEEPMPVTKCEAHIGASEMLAGRQNVENGEPDHGLGEVESQPVGTPATAIVASDVEAIEPQPAHHRDRVASHGSLRIRFVVGRGLGLGAIAVSTKVRGHHRELRGQAGRDLTPHRISLRMPVQEQERWTRTTVPDTKIDLSR